ncbi:MAG TPA: integrase core domain-containing protein, partial [Ktedonobacterales bacterium]|nr:integrase core domain-containing protein [Ktedonobacterales bacterium]
SVLFGERCAAALIRSSMATVGDCYDNALAERFFATLEGELLATPRFHTHAEARATVFEWLEVFYNRQRRRSALGYVAPALYEQTATTPTPGAAETKQSTKSGSLHSPLGICAAGRTTRSSGS